MKRKLLSILLALAMCLSLLPTFALAATTYHDTNGHWAEGAIDRWSGYGVVNGKGEATFDPDGPMRRGEAAQMFANLLGLNKEGDLSAYPDAQGDWFTSAIAKCVAAGILNGKGYGVMDPNGLISREEFLTMYARAICISNGTDPAEAKTGLEQKGFADTDKVSDWAADAIGTLVDKGYVNGMTATEIAPQANINRASVMALLDQSVSTYVGKDSTETTVAAKSEGITLIANPAVTTVTGTADVVVVAAGAEQYDAATGEITHNDIRVESAKMPVARVQGENITVTLALSTTAEDATVTETGVDSIIVIESTAAVKNAAVAAEGAKIIVKDGAKAETVTVAETAKSATVETAKNATVGTLTIAAESATASVAGKVETVKVEETAKNATIDTKSTAKVETVENKAENTAVTGTGSVGAVKSSEDVKIETKNTKVENTSETKEIAVTDSKGTETKVDSGSTGQTTPSAPTGGGGGGHSHYYTIQTDGSWKCSCEYVYPKTDNAYICRVVNGQPKDVISLVDATAGSFNGSAYADVVTIDKNDIKYNHSKATDAWEVVIRTNIAKTKLEVNAPADTVNHYGAAGEVLVEAIKGESYHENGTIAFIEINAGHVVIESNGKVELMYANPSAGSTVKLTNSGNVHHAHTDTKESAEALNSVSTGITFDYNNNTEQNAINDIYHHVDDQTAVTGTGEKTSSNYDIEQAKTDTVNAAMNVAKIGEVYYENLFMAFDAIKTMTTATIEIINDIDMTGKDWAPITLDSNQVITIEGNGHTINNLTVSNYLNAGSGSGDIGSGNAASYYAGFIGQNSGTLTINNISFNNAYVDMAVPSTSEGSSILAVVVGNNYGTVVLNDVNVYSSVTKGYTKVGILHGYSQDGSFTVNHCAFENCKIILEKDGIGTTPLFSGIVAGFDYDCNVKVNGVKLVNNSFEFDESVDQSLYSNISTTSSGLIRATTADGTYGIFAPIYATGNGMVESGILYTINGYSYNLTSVIVAAKDGDTIICDADVALGSSDVIAKGITLDLNGHKLSVSGASVLGNVKGASEITVDVGTVSFDPTSYLTRADVNVINNNDGTWTVKSFDSFDDAVAAGYYFTNTSAFGTGSKFFKTAQEAVDAKIYNIYFLKDVEDAAIGSFNSVLTGSSYCLYLNGHSYKNATIDIGISLKIYSNKEATAELESITCWALTVGKSGASNVNAKIKTATFKSTVPTAYITTCAGSTLMVNFDPSANVNSTTHNVTDNNDGTWTVTAK